MASETLNVVIRSNAQGKGAEEAQKGLSGLQKTIGVLSAAFGALKGAQAAVDFVQFGAGVQRQGQALDGLARSAGTTGAAITQAIQGASDFTIDRMTAMSSATKAMILDVADSPEQFERLTKVAVTLGKAMGQDAAKSIDDFVVAAGRQSKVIADNLGLMVGAEDANVKYAAKLGKTVEALTEAEKKQAFLNEMLDQGERKMAALAGSTDSAATDIEKVTAAVAEAKAGFAVLLVEGLSKVVGEVDEFAARIRMLPQAMGQVIAVQRAWTRAQQEFVTGGGIRGAVEEFNNTLKRHALEMLNVRTASEELRYAYTIQESAAGNAAVATGKASSALAEATEPINVHIERQGALEFTILNTARAIEAETEAARKQLEVSQNLTQSKLELAQALKNEGELEIAQAAVKELGSAYSSGLITFDQYATAVQETQVAFGLTNEAAAGMAGRLVGLIEQMANGQLAAGDFNEELANGIEIYEGEIKQIDKFGETLASMSTDAANPATMEEYMLTEQTRLMGESMGTAQGLTDDMRDALLRYRTGAQDGKDETDRLRLAIDKLPKVTYVDIVYRYRTEGDKPKDAPKEDPVPVPQTFGMGGTPRLTVAALRGGAAAGMTNMNIYVTNPDPGAVVREIEKYMRLKGHVRWAGLGH